MKTHLVRYIFSEPCVPTSYGYASFYDYYCSSLEDCRNHSLPSNVNYDKLLRRLTFFRYDENSYWMRVYD